MDAINQANTGYGADSNALRSGLDAQAGQEISGRQQQEIAYQRQQEAVKQQQAYETQQRAVAYQQQAVARQQSASRASASNYAKTAATTQTSNINAANIRFQQEYAQGTAETWLSENPDMINDIGATAYNSMLDRVQKNRPLQTVNYKKARNNDNISPHYANNNDFRIGIGGGGRVLM